MFIRGRWWSKNGFLGMGSEDAQGETLFVSRLRRPRNLMYKLSQPCRARLTSVASHRIVRDAKGVPLAVMFCQRQEAGRRRGLAG
jgi:hypothetical protein